MKRLFSLVCIMVLCAGMAQAASSNARGLLWMDTTEPVYIATDYVNKSPKVGTSTSVNILRLITKGDAGVRKAVEDGGIKKIHYIDQDIKKFVVFYEKRTTRVYGE